MNNAYDLLAVIDEAVRADGIHGAQLDTDGRVYGAGWYGVPPSDIARDITERRFAHGSGTWGDILVEEVAEAHARPVI